MRRSIQLKPNWYIKIQNSNNINTHKKEIVKHEWNKMKNGHYSMTDGIDKKHIISILKDKKLLSASFTWGHNDVGFNFWNTLSNIILTDI